MFWRTLILAFAVTSVLAQEIPVSDQQREQYRQMLEAQCRKMGNEDKVQEVQVAVHSFINCLKELVDLQTLQNEIEAAKPNGELDEVFKKYCAKTPQLKTCISSLLDGVKPCVDQVAQDSYGPVLNTTGEIIDFICHKDGERIALFIAYGGPDCFKNKREQLQVCGNNIRAGIPNLEAAKSMSVVDKCKKFDELTTCVVQELEKCDNPTPANMAESLLKYARKGSSCATEVPLKN